MSNQRFARSVRVCLQAAQNLRAYTCACMQDTEQEMLGTDVAIASL
jgi:hypothetical protein